MKILLVDDNYELLDVLKAMLTRLRGNVEIDEATDGDEAFLEIQLFPRDLRAQVEEMNREFIRAQRQEPHEEP